MKKIITLFLFVFIFSLNVNAQSKTICVPMISLASIYNAGVITVDKIQTIKEVKFGCFSDPKLNYEVVSLKLVILPPSMVAIRYELHQSIFNDLQLDSLSKATADTLIFIEDAKVKTPDGKDVLLLPPYIITVVK